MSQAQEEASMSQAEAMLGQFKQEAAGTRKMLERVPFDKADWAPGEERLQVDDS